MPKLLDVNSLLAFAWPNHQHHGQVRAWFQLHHLSGWATCPIVESGFVRVSCHARITPEAVTPDEAIELLRRIRLLPGHEFWTDDFSISTVEVGRIRGHRQVTDFHLLNLAMSRRGKLVTLDRGIADLVPTGVDLDDVLIQL